jgi:hypothetical protein
MSANRKLSEELAVTTYELDAEGPADVAWVATENFNKALFQVMRTVGTGGLDALKILGNTLADGSGTDVTLVDYSTSVTLSTIDAVGDTVFMEVGQEVFDANPTMLGISVSLGHVTATDESVVTYILGDPRQTTGALTADAIA